MTNHLFCLLPLLLFCSYNNYKEVKVSYGILHNKALDNEYDFKRAEILMSFEG